ncbi:CsbD family protein [Rhodovibrio salinarum]|uniref:CsbD family protein n=1 Tax=Rhodovibrio salinarum TaxID=1087 RepID=A0A934QHW5_9PROT|nr:CsbD family protein [Rhodovibrio salinarum]MBK1697098.1 CsbD family protein [Rhodovibrio salinarum]
MANTKLKGLAKQVVGDIQQALGKLTGRKTAVAKGKAKTAAGTTQQTAGKIKSKAKKLGK